MKLRIILSLVVASLPLLAFYFWNHRQTDREVVEAAEKLGGEIESRLADAKSGRPSFVEMVEKHFPAWVRPDAELSWSRVNELIRNRAIRGDEAAALAAIHPCFQSKETVGQEQTLVLMLSRKDLLARAAADPNLEARFRNARDYLDSMSRQLFAGPEAPSLAGIAQGRLADCYLLATTGSTLHLDPAVVRRMIQTRPDGSYDVAFQDGQKIHVPEVTDGMIALGSRAGQQGIWLNVLETAYGDRRLSFRGRTGELPEDALNDGYPTHVMPLFTGRQATSLAIQPGQATEARLRDLLREGAPAKRLLVATTSKNAKLPPRIIGHHCYAILDYHPATDQVKIWNPWGAYLNFRPEGPAGLEHGYPTQAGVFEVPLRDFTHIFGWVAHDRLSAPSLLEEK